MNQLQTQNSIQHKNSPPLYTLQHSKNKIYSPQRQASLYRSVGNNYKSANTLLLNKMRDNNQKLYFKQSLPRMKLATQDKQITKNIRKIKSKSTLLNEIQQKINGIKGGTVEQAEKKKQQNPTISTIFSPKKYKQFQNLDVESYIFSKNSNKFDTSSSQKHLKTIEQQSNYKALKNKDQCSINRFCDKIDQKGQRSSAPVTYKNQYNAFWANVFEAIKIKGKQQPQCNIQNTEKSPQKSRQFKKKLDSFIEKDKVKDIKNTKSQPCQKFYYPQKYQREMIHKNSLDYLGKTQTKPNKDENELKKRCQKSSQILKNTKLLLQNIKNSPYFYGSNQNKQQENQTSHNKNTNYGTRLKTVQAQPIQFESEANMCNMNANQKQKINQINQSSSTNFTSTAHDAQNPFLSISQLSQKYDFSSSRVSYQNLKVNQSNQIQYPEKRAFSRERSQITRKRINSPISDRPLKTITLSDFKKLKVKSVNHEEQILDTIGFGKFGNVYLCRHNQTQIVCALKQISKQKIRKYRMIQQAVDQIKIHSFLCHPNITKMFGFFQQKDNIYLVLQYLEGGTLFEYINQKGSVPLKIALGFLQDIIKAVQYIHEKNIAHRDIKPENILLANRYFHENQQHFGTAKLCDFGWSASMQTSRRTYCGTFQYVPPQVLQRKRYDISVDIWSIGVLTYEMLTGKVPYEGDRSTVIFNKINQVQIDYPQINEKFPIQAKQFIQALVKKNPKDRPLCKDLLKMPLFEKYSHSLSDGISTIFQSPKSWRDRTAKH